MRIAIAGAGMAGAYLYRLLVNRGLVADIFDKPKTTKCGLTPCAWGTSKGFDELVNAAGLKSSDYLLVPSKELFMDGLKVRADLWTFDKRRLISDLLRGAEIQYRAIDPSRYDRVIDATGVARSCLPAIPDDLTLPCIQYRIATSLPRENRISLGGIGYAWFFPLSDNEYHVGCGSLVSDPKEVLRNLGWVKAQEPGRTILCACRGEIRLSGPRRSLPFVAHEGRCEIWGIGEAIGCVAPLAGDGVVSGMRSAQLLIRSWDDPSQYTASLLREFNWMNSERRVVDKLAGNKGLGIKDAWILKRNSARMGMEIGVTDAFSLLQHLK